VTHPTLEECHVTAGKLIQLQSMRLVTLADFRSAVRRAVTEPRHDGSSKSDGDIVLEILRLLKDSP
jgi:hypothetical protein